MCDAALTKILASPLLAWFHFDTYAFMRIHASKNSVVVALPSSETGMPIEEELEPVLDAVSGYFALLAEPIRLKILHALCNQELSVSEVMERIQATQTSVSRHLTLMHKAGVLGRRRDGQQVFYSVIDPNAIFLCRTVCNSVAANLGDPQELRPTIEKFMSPEIPR